MEIIPEWARFEVEEVVELACRVNVNAHGVRDDSGSNLVIGLGMFPLVAMVNHACRPNCTFVYYGEHSFAFSVAISTSFLFLFWLKYCNLFFNFCLIFCFILANGIVQTIHLFSRWVDYG